MDALEDALGAFAILITQKRTHELLAMFNDYVKNELHTCAHFCRKLDQDKAADSMTAHANQFAVSADDLMTQHLRK